MVAVFLETLAGKLTGLKYCLFFSYFHLRLKSFKLLDESPWNTVHTLLVPREWNNFGFLVFHVELLIQFHLIKMLTKSLQKYWLYYQVQVYFGISAKYKLWTCQKSRLWCFSFKHANELLAFISMQHWLNILKFQKRGKHLNKNFCWKLSSQNKKCWMCCVSWRTLLQITDP